jgi:uncharacterized protein with von Willebrand factor type A (vWA) domain
MRARLQEFVGALRQSGVAISVAESLDAMQAVAVAGVERERLREALAATLVKDERDRGTFDGLFEEYFPLPPPGDPLRRRRKRTRTQPAGGAGARGTAAGERGGRDAVERAVPAAPREPRPASESSRPGARLPARRRNREDELSRRPFRELTAQEVGELREVVAMLAEQLRRRLARRWRRARHGPIDLRRTLRATAATGGVPLRLARRTRRPARPDLLALCDLSGSVAAASELLLALLAPVGRYFRRVALYAYVDHLCPITVEDGRLVPDGPLDLYGRSDLGRVLVELMAAAPRVSAGALVLVLGDARNNRRPPRADLVRKLRARAERLVWIVPEPRARWNTGDSVLAAYARSCDAVYECVDLRGLERAVRQAIA